jgi:hypothetical protein
MQYDSTLKETAIWVALFNHSSVQNPIQLDESSLKYNKGYYGVWWTSTERSSNNQSACFRYLFTEYAELGGSWWKIAGFSMKCLKD